NARVRNQRVEFRTRTVSLETHLGAHVGEADGFFRQIAGAPNPGDVEITLELDFELENGDPARDRVGVDADRKARAEGGERGLRRVGRGVIAEQAWRLVDHV